MTAAIGTNTVRYFDLETMSLSIIKQFQSPIKKFLSNMVTFLIKMVLT